MDRNRAVGVTPRQRGSAHERITVMRELVLAAAYLLGSIPFAFLFVKAAGRGDVRRVGSGNVGATNAMRAAGWKVALPIAILDIGKGAAAVLLMRQVTASPVWLTAAGLAAIVGHCYPVWLRFSGGKGVATGAGAFITLAWLPTLAVAVVWVVVLAAFRYVSLASVVAVAVFPGALVLLGAPTMPVVGCAVAAVLVIIWRHGRNVRQLVAGTEPKLGRGSR